MKRLLLILLSSIFITACGTGSSNNSVSFEDATTSKVSGVAAAGTVISGTAYLRDSATTPVQLTKTIATDGSYSFNVTGMTKPYLLKAVGTANGTSYTLYSLATDKGTANINPLTNLIVSNASGGSDLATIYSTVEPTAIKGIASNLTQALSDVKSSLNPLLQSYSITSVNPISDTYTANHTGLDGLFDAEKITVSNGTVTVTVVATNSVIFTAPVASITTGTVVVPVANAGSDQHVVVSTPVTLAGSASRDANNNVLSYSWTLTSRPVGSAATLANPTTVSPTFTPDIIGAYVLDLIVNDGYINSGADSVIINVEIPTTKSVVSMVTSLGTIKIALYETLAPISTSNFLNYVNTGFYSNTIFHRVIPDFMVQCGGFTSDLVRKVTNAPIKNEAANGLKNIRGTVGMARSSLVDSATSQFFVNVVDNNTLDYTSSTTQGYGYTVFGMVIEGMDIVDKIAAVSTGTSNGMDNVPLVPIVILSASVLP